MGRIENKPTKRRAQTLQRKQATAEQAKIPFGVHVQELRKRLFYVAVSVGVFASVAYAVQRQLTSLLLKPAGAQQFIYTTPGGGFDFQFKLCLYAGIAASIPVIVYQILRYLHPLLKHESRRFLAWAALCSSVLAAGGIVFGYALGLPAAMHFLLQGLSTTKQIEALISIQSYMSFVIMYLLGTAMLFQIPLILVLINRVKPLQPKKLLKQQRWLIVVSLIIGAVISPTPDIRNQLIFSLPIIAMYDASVAIIWLANRRKHRPHKVVELLQKDIERRARRLQAFETARDSLHIIDESSPLPSAMLQPTAAGLSMTTGAISGASTPSPAAAVTSAAAQSQPQPMPASRQRPSRHTEGFTRRRFIS